MSIVRLTRFKKTNNVSHHAKAEEEKIIFTPDITIPPSGAADNRVAEFTHGR
jgi:hypothetical protein